MDMWSYLSDNKTRNEVICEKVGVATIEYKMREEKLSWFGLDIRRPSDAPVRRHPERCKRRKR